MGKSKGKEHGESEGTKFLLKDLPNPFQAALKYFLIIRNCLISKKKADKMVTVELRE